MNETWLHGRARRLRVTGVVFILAALGLADLPPFATFLGKGWIEDSAGARGLPWVIAGAHRLLGPGRRGRAAGGGRRLLRPGRPAGRGSEMAQEAAEETSETTRASGAPR